MLCSKVIKPYVSFRYLSFLNQHYIDCIKDVSSVSIKNEPKFEKYRRTLETKLENATGFMKNIKNENRYLIYPNDFKPNKHVDMFTTTFLNIDINKKDKFNYVKSKSSEMSCRELYSIHNCFSSRTELLEDDYVILSSYLMFNNKLLDYNFKYSQELKNKIHISDVEIPFLLKKLRTNIIDERPDSPNVSIYIDNWTVRLNDNNVNYEGYKIFDNEKYQELKDDKLFPIAKAMIILMNAFPVKNINMYFYSSLYEWLSKMESSNAFFYLTDKQKKMKIY